MFHEDSSEFPMAALVVVIFVVIIVTVAGGLIFHEMNHARTAQASADQAKRDLQTAKAEVTVRDIEIKHWREASVVVIAAAGIETDPADPPTPEKLTAALNPCWKVAENDQALKKVCAATDGNPKIKIVVDKEP